MIATSRAAARVRTRILGLTTAGFLFGTRIQLTRRCRGHNVRFGRRRRRAHRPTRTTVVWILDGRGKRGGNPDEKGEGS